MSYEYELLLDVQKQKCYTCANNGKCDPLNHDCGCNYKISDAAKIEIKDVDIVFGTL